MDIKGCPLASLGGPGQAPSSLGLIGVWGNAFRLWDPLSLESRGAGWSFFGRSRGWRAFTLPSPPPSPPPALAPLSRYQGTFLKRTS